MANIRTTNSAWERLSIIIKESGMTIHSFAAFIQLPRSETLYQIKRGQIGISRHVARAVIEHFPEYSEAWLQSGFGTMYSNPSRELGYIPYYNCEIAQIADIDSMEASDYLYLPMVTDFDFAVTYLGDEMQPIVTAGSVLVLKQVGLQSVVYGNIYLVRTEHFVALRVVRTATEFDQLRLVAINSDKYDDIVVTKSDIVEIYSIKANINLKN